MKAFAFVYSRTRNHDYRVLSGLSVKVCDDEVNTVFLQRVRGLLETKSGVIGLPQWLLVKEKGNVLWGVACMNEVLDSSYSLDKFSRPLRGFTGIVVPDYSSETLPYDLDVFKVIFRDVMASIFDSFTQQNLTDRVVEVGHTIRAILPIPFDSRLNTDYHICRLFSPTADAETLMASCLSCREDISIAINVGSVNSVTTCEFNPLNNAVMSEPVDGGVEDYPVMHQCKVCGDASLDLQEGLCQTCWDKQHPHCRECGREISQLNDGLCQNCYDKEHPHCAICGIESYYLKNGLCPDCWGKNNIYCVKCGRKMPYYTANGICEDCNRKKRLQTLCYYAAMILLVIVVFSVRKCKQTHEKNIIEPTVFEKVDTARPQEPIISHEVEQDTVAFNGLEFF